MPGRPIVFISHFTVKPGHLDAIRPMWDAVSPRLEASRPATSAFVGFLDATGAKLSIVHVFPDADAMAAHVVGAGDRSQAAYEHLTPAGWEIYGTPHPADLAMMREAAEAAGVQLSIAPEALGGFLRSAPR
jgi:hypothetical protein